MLFTIALMCLVASPERSARRCTSSATTVKPRPASPAEAAWMAAFSASTLVCSVMSEISCTISPISCELSPSRLMCLEVSWICTRMSFMPRIAFCTACAPLPAACSEVSATLAESLALFETSFIDCAICATDWPVPLISVACLKQATEIQGTGQSVAQMAQSMNEVSKSANDSAKVAETSLHAAGKGAQAVQNAIRGMNDIRVQIQETSKRIKRLGESSQEIGEIVQLISDITEQTN